MRKPGLQATRELDTLRNSHVVAWLRDAMEELKRELITQRDIDTLRIKQGEALFLQNFLDYVDGAAQVLDRR